MKKTMTVLLSIGIIACLAACGTQAPAATTPAPAATEEPKTEAPAATEEADAAAEEETAETDAAQTDTATEEETTETNAAEADAEAEKETAETDADEAEAAAGKWEPKLSDEDKAILEKLGTLTRHTPVTEDSLSWSFDAASGTLTVSGTGPMKDYSRSDPSPARDYMDAVTRIVVEDGITTIGAYAFYDLYLCANAQLPDSVEYIGDYAFAFDSDLAEIPFPAGLLEIGEYAFAEVKLHKALEIPEGVEIIGRKAFAANDARDTIHIPASACYIAETAFANSLGLHDFTVADGNPNYAAQDGVLYSKDLSVLFCYPIYKEETHFDIPKTVTRIADRAFDQNVFLKTVSIPASVAEVGESIFREFPYMEEYTVDEKCPALASVDGVLYSKDMKILYDYPRCKAADTFTVPAEVEAISGSCFSLCENLKKLYVPGTVKTVERNAFFIAGGELYLTADFVGAEVGDTSLHSVSSEKREDFSEDLTYTPPAQREPDADPVVVPWKNYDKMTVFFEGTQEQWDAFVDEAGLYLGDTEVICDTPYPGE